MTDSKKAHKGQDAMSFDSIYRQDRAAQDFSFNAEVSQVFDDMVERSVPLYLEAQTLIASFIRHNVQNGTRLYDLGCATGTSIFLLDQVIGDGKKLDYYGLDQSRPMLAKAEEKMKAHWTSSNQVHWVEADICEYDRYDNAGCFLLNLTLQFIRPLKRIELIARLYDHLHDDGILVLFEKLVEPHSRFNRAYIELHHDFKRRNHYSDMEIAKKREELENVLIPFTERENYEMLHKAGFRHVSTLFKYVNFGVILAVK